MMPSAPSVAVRRKKSQLRFDFSLFAIPWGARLATRHDGAEACS